MGTPTALPIDTYVFDDGDRDGLQDADEAGIGGVETSIDGAQVVTTGENGRFRSTIKSAGTHSFTETDPALYYSTTPNTVSLPILLGYSYDVVFGDSALSSCSLTLSPASATNQLPGDTSETFTVGLVDRYGAGLSGVAVGLSADFGSLSANSVATVDGSASFSISSDTQGMATITATVGSLSATATSVWKPASTGGGGGGGGFVPPSPTTTAAQTPSVTPTPEPSVEPITTPPVEYFRADFLGLVSSQALKKDGRLADSLDAPSPDGQHVLRLPKGTKTIDMSGNPVNLIKITVVDTVPSLPSDMVLLGDAYDFEPSGISFDKEVSLSLGYDANDIKGKVASVGIESYTPETGWVAVDSSPGVVAGIGTVTGQINHFSIYAVLGKPVPVSESLVTTTPSAQFSASNLTIAPEHNVFWSGFPLITIDGKDISVTVDATNFGDKQGEWNLAVSVDGRSRLESAVSLDVQQTRTLAFNLGGNLPGRHIIQIGDLSAEFVTIWTINWWLLSPLVVIAGLVGWLISVYIRRIRAAKARTAG